MFRGGVLPPVGNRVAATIDFDDGCIVARGDDGLIRRMRFAECVLEYGGHDDRLLFCRSQGDQTAIFCGDPGFAAALATAAGPWFGDQLDGCLAGRRHRSRSRMVAAACVLLLIAGLTVATFLGLRFAADAAVGGLPQWIDRGLGEATWAVAVDRFGAGVQDPGVVGPLQGLVDRLVAGSGHEGFAFRVHVADSEEVNAMAMPGGRIVVCTGLIGAVADPDELAGVLAHEVAHVIGRDHLRLVVKDLGVRGAVRVLFGDAEGLLAASCGLATAAIGAAHSRAEEAEADRVGAGLLHAAGIDPRGLGRFFQRLLRQEGEHGGVSGILATHPCHAARCARLVEAAATLPIREYRPALTAEEWERVRAVSASARE